MYNKSDFDIYQSDRYNKKYYAILKTDEDKKRIYFGAIRPNGIPYDQFRDSTNLKIYSQYDHNDEERRQRYIARHKKNIKTGFTAGWLSYLFLWS